MPKVRKKIYISVKMDLEGLFDMFDEEPRKWEPIQTDPDLNSINDISFSMEQIQEQDRIAALEQQEQIMFNYALFLSEKEV